MDPHTATARPGDMTAGLDQAWREHRRHLLDVGFRILGNLSEAEDSVQEAFARLARTDLASIDDVGGWLVVVVSRLCIDKLRADRRHATYPDSSIGDRFAAPDAGPADRVTLDGNVCRALQLLLERLTPAERTAFILHDVFRYPFAEIAEIVGRTPAACRQLASRARRTIAKDGRSPARIGVESAEQRLVTEQFITACTTGDVDGLLAILDPDVAGDADVGGRIGTVTVTGRIAVARQTMRFFGPDATTTLISLPTGSQPGIVAIRNGHIVAIVALTIEDGRVHDVDGIVDPTKLAPIAQALGSR